MLNKIKLLLGITDSTKDQLLMVLIQQALDEAKNYTHNDWIPDSLVCQIVAWKYNHLGVEGLTSENYSGVSFSYSTDYPDNILRQLKALRKVVTL